MEKTATKTAEMAWLQWSRKYKIHPETLASTQRIMDLGLKPLYQTTLEEARENVAMECRDGEDVVPFNGTVKEMMIPCTEVKTGIPVTVYKPSDCPADPIIFIYFHGGGLVMVHTNSFDCCMKSLAKKTKAIMVIPEYRLLPCTENPMAPFDDCLAVTKWVMKNKEKVGGSKNSKVGLGGDSVGGQLTCSVLNDVQGVAFQVLVYPVIDLTCNLPSHQEFKEIPAFNTLTMEAMFKLYVPHIPGAATNPRVNPSAMKNLQSSPPAMVIMAELDPLRDWGVAFAKKLRDAGVKVKEMTYEGVPHWFFSRVADYPTMSAKAHDEVAKFVTSFQ
ncbi:ethyl acetate hydrolase-like [Physella acuta]|uniref:ethyl acetate hydrolase-like n=1 Tax=Physella acuta TaxID=109671 RepID=UPI0027DE5D53|nr:ethyl acetate hydrolase-like [Physella acuta]